jgi:hypothetical protein
MNPGPKPVEGSDAEGSKIQNVVVGLVALAVAFTLCVAVALAQQPKKVPR